jgi:Domain of unknown function (DUF4281)
MPWELIFKLANGWAALLWLLLAFGPRQTMWVRAIFLSGTAALALAYSVLIIGLISGGINGGGAAASGSPDFTTLSGVMALFDTPGGTTIGWIHYLAFDLFVGIWIARNADRHAIARIWQVPMLFLTFMLGPLGLFSYLIARAFLGKKLENGFTPR